MLKALFIPSGKYLKSHRNNRFFSKLSSVSHRSSLQFFEDNETEGTETAQHNVYSVYEATQPVDYDQTNKLDSHMLVQMIRECTCQGFIHGGQNLHSYALISGLASVVFVSSALVAFYVRLVSTDDAQQLFDEMPERNVVTWNTMISGFVRFGQFHQALNYFISLYRSDTKADDYSFTAGLAACGRLSMLYSGFCLHSQIVRHGWGTSVVVANSLIDTYGKCGSVEDAVKVFSDLNETKDVISWNSVIAACARNGMLQLASDYLYQVPNPDAISYNELINGAAQFGEMGDALKILVTMPSPNSSSWNSIITSYVNRNWSEEALEIFSDMHTEGVRMDRYTFSSILSGIARLADLKWGSIVHCCVLNVGLDTLVIVASALIDMYSKCGQVNQAELLFRSLPTKSIVTWNAMISGFARNGEPDKVIEHFEMLKREDKFIPDDVTFLNVLAACSHCQMPIGTAYRYFQSMVQDYGIEPTVEQITSMVRLMGQHGEVRRAEKLIHELGFEKCGTVWRALLGASRTCEDLEVAKGSAAKVTEYEGHDDEYPFVILANINASYGKWTDVNALWDKMKKKGVSKEPVLVGFRWKMTEGRSRYIFCKQQIKMVLGLVPSDNYHAGPKADWLGKPFPPQSKPTVSTLSCLALVHPSTSKR